MATEADDAIEADDEETLAKGGKLLCSDGQNEAHAYVTAQLRDMNARPTVEMDRVQLNDPRHRPTQPGTRHVKDVLGTGVAGAALSGGTAPLTPIAVGGATTPLPPNVGGATAALPGDAPQAKVVIGGATAALTGFFSYRSTVQKAGALKFEAEPPR